MYDIVVVVVVAADAAAAELVGWRLADRPVVLLALETSESLLAAKTEGRDALKALVLDLEPAATTNTTARKNLIVVGSPPLGRVFRWDNGGPTEKFLGLR